jgi:predicted pyridoxine 5'-phosphate oxidase superfamily flavin-nucleotide-binding protein
MAETVSHSLNEQLLPLLQKERFVLLSTIDKDTGAPNVSAISWVYAPNESKVRFAVDQRSRILENINQNSKVILSVIGSGSVFSIAGDASVDITKLEGVPLKLSMATISISEVRDVMFYGSRISVEPEYEKTYDKDAAAKLDNQVMNALKNA